MLAQSDTTPCRALVVVAEKQSDDFNWTRDVTLQEQRRTAIYRNPRGDVVIRQERDWPDNDTDDIVIIADNNLQCFIDELCEIAGIRSAP